MLSNFTPATPVSELVEGVVVMAERYRYRRESKQALYIRLFNDIASRQGYTVTVVNNIFIVYQDDSQIYQCLVNHENVLRAYTALRYRCGDSVAEFMQFTSNVTQLTEEMVPVRTAMWG